MYTLRQSLLTGLLGLCLLPMANAQTQPAPISIPFVAGEVEVDGALNEPQWQNAQRVELDYVVRPFENTTPPVATHALVFEDGETLYVGFVASDPNPEDIRAFYRDRDKTWGDDLVGIKLDTFNDSRLAYQFFVNPYGVQSDSIENEMTGRESDSWDTIWQSEGQIGEDGYVVEMAIPLRTLNFKEGERNKVWGAEFVRFYPRKDTYRISNTPIDRNNSCTLCQLEEVEGFENATQGENLALVPTLVMARGRERDPTESLDWDYNDKQEVGLDVKWGITPEVSLLATLNPDFSQVEADVAQLSINNNFSLFFEEKRPFFLENADYFSSNFNLVYTRNISSPDYGAKLTGRIGDNTLGVFVANDESTTFLVPGNLGSSVAELDEESINVALRYRYDVTKDLSVGLVSTLRDAGDYHNYVNGVDVKYQITEQDTLRAQVVHSDTQYPDDLFLDFCDNDCSEPEDLSEAALRTMKDGSFTDLAYRVDYTHQERDWFFRARHVARGADFRGDLGFESRADQKFNVLGGGYIWYNENSWWNRIELSGDWDKTENDNGELIEEEREMAIHINANYQSYGRLQYVSRDRVGLRIDESTLDIDGNTTLFNEDFWRVVAEARPSSMFFMGVRVDVGDQIDFANNRLGEKVFVRPRLDWNIGKHLQLRFRHTYSALDADGADVFTANLTDARITYQFDQRQFLRLIAVYSDISRNPDNYLDDVTAEDKSLGFQLLYSYKINPLTKFFVGYSDSAFSDDDITSMTTTEQSVFMKFSYAWLK